MAKRSARKQIREDLLFHRRHWAFQRAGWAVVAVLLLLAALGLFGDGVLSRASATSPALTVQYERFVRRHGPTQIDLDALAPGPRELKLAVTRAYLDALRIESVVPEPSRVEGGDGEVVFVFDALPSARSTKITLHVTPTRIGRFGGQLRLEGSGDAAVSVRQLALP